jgi:hypothetical protein
MNAFYNKSRGLRFIDRALAAPADNLVSGDRRLSSRADARKMRSMAAVFAHSLSPCHPVQRLVCDAHGFFDAAIKIPRPLREQDREDLSDKVGAGAERATH